MQNFSQKRRIVLQYVELLYYTGSRQRKRAGLRKLLSVGDEKKTLKL
jgi:hypothetical protein